MSRSPTLTLPAPALDSHRAAVVMAVVVVFAILAVFAGTVASMAGIWLSSETFSHGFIVVPVALWLIWRRRAELAVLPIRPFLPALPLLIPIGMLWLAGHLANANVVEHLALVLMIQCAVLVVLGWAFVRAIAFPLLFLCFAIPFGEAFVPRMIDWTADFTVLALKATGIPLYREGNDFTLPTGHWSVAKACSGIRYLIASVMAGTLFAYIMYSTFWRRVAFIAVSAIVPIVANWLRAYLIVLMGHLSGNELATGVDHIIYGWIFFGLVLLVMFAIGARFRSDDVDPDPAAAPGGTGLRDAPRGALSAAAVATLVLALPWAPLGAALMSEGGERPRVLDVIPSGNGWKAFADQDELWLPAFTGERATRRQVFERDGQRVAIHIAYYSGQSQDRKLVSAANTLVAPTGETRWHEKGKGSIDVDWRGTPFTAKRSTIAGAGGRFDVVWWYWIDGRVTSDDATAKIWIALSRVRMRGDDAAVVFLFTPPAERSDQGAAAKRFLADMSEPISHVLEAAGNAGPGPTARGSSP